MIKLQAERFLSPGEAGKGVYSLEQKCGEMYTADEPNAFGALIYDMQLEGYGLDSEGKKDKGRKSFAISISMEARFDILGGKISRANELNKLCPDLIGQVHALGTMRLIALAADLGFPGVRPRLSIPREAIPKYEPNGMREIELKEDE